MAIIDVLGFMSKHGHARVRTHTLMFYQEIFDYCALKRYVMPPKSEMLIGNNDLFMKSIKGGGALTNRDILTKDDLQNIINKSPHSYRTYSYDLNKPLKFLALGQAELINASFYNEDTESVTGKVYHMSRNSYEDVEMPLCFFAPNDSQFLEDDWKKVFWGGMLEDETISGGKKPCKECKDTGSVELFQFFYNCSICGDGKRR